MTGLLRKAVLVAAVAAVVAAPAAMAGVPDPTKSAPLTSNCGVMLTGLGDNFATPAPGVVANPFVVVVHDATDAPVSGINVYIDITSTSDLRFANVQEAGTIVDCTNKRIYRVTDAAGSATFHIRGSAKNSLPLGGIGPGGANQVKVVAGSTLIKNVSLAAADQNGGGTGGTVVAGIDAGDGSFTRYDILNFAAPNQATRSDFNCTSAPDAADGSILRAYILNDAASGAGSITTGDYCVPS
jgi:hypothetical protein